MLKKNDVVTVTIEDITMNGEGIGKVDGYTLFVKDAVIGDVVRVIVINAKKAYGYGRLDEIITPSPSRVEARCPIARKCGGCQIQEMDYEAQLKFKEKMVRDNLTRIGQISPDSYTMHPIIGMEDPWHYRNKAQFPVGTNKDGAIKMGFYGYRSHVIMETKECFIGDSVNEQVLGVVRTFMEKNRVMPYDEEKGMGLIRHILIRKGFKTGQVMVCIVINANKLPKGDLLVNELIKLPGMTSISYCINKEQTNVIMGNKVVTLWGTDYIEDIIGDIKYRISPLSFFQVNPIQTEKLYNKALEYAGLTGNEIVWDLYCGIGTISLFLARQCKKVYGVEIIPQAIENAKENASINDIKNAEFFVGKAEEVLPAYYEEQTRLNGHKLSADVIVVDPPRKGCEESLLKTIVDMEPKRVVYVSCDSATLARDVKYMVANGYEVKDVQPVDQFGHTVHVECVVLMSRVDK